MRAAHQVAGSAGTFGRERASRLARDVERFLADGAPATPELLLPALAALEALHRELAGPEVPETAAPAAVPSGRRLLVAHSEADLARRLLAAAHERGWHAEWVPDLPRARAALAEALPELVLVGLALPPGGATDLLRDLGQAQEPIPALVIYDGDELLDRVEASRAGARGFVDSGLGPERIVAAAIDTLAAQDHGAPRIRALDDDVLILDVVELLFQESRVDVRRISDPSQFWVSLAEYEPDLLLLDVDMPGANGLELCHMVRSDVRWASIPIVVLTGSLSADDVTAVYAAGADDYVTKPVDGVELRARVLNRLQRERTRRRSAQSDPLTGLLNRSAFEAAFQTLRHRAALTHDPVSVGLIEVEPVRGPSDLHGHEARDEALRRLASILRAHVSDGDVLCRWVDHEVVVVMVGLDRSKGVARLSTVLDAWREQSLGVSGGVRPGLTAAVSELGADGTDMATLYRGMAATIRGAGRAGVDRVVPTGWRSDVDPAVVDVLLVEDDEELGTLLMHSLRTQGMRGAHVADGAAAVEILTGRESLRARVVLLDVDLPGLNGLDVLERLAAAGVLGTSRVIMLTARAGEAETLAALRLGAFDHVGKPFSLPVLIHRVRRALDA